MALLNYLADFLQRNKKIFLGFLFIASVAYAGTYLDSLDVDNINLDGNTISSTNSNGDITLDPNGTGGVAFNDLTATTVPYLDANKEITSSAVTPTELGYLSGVTSAIQTQLDAKIDDFTGSTDNVIIRTDGTGGDAVQESGISIDDSDVMSGITQLNADNLRLDGNVLSSTDVNGNITLTPNGTGEVESSANLNVLTQGDLRLQDTTGGEYIAIQAPSAVTSSTTLTLPDGAGSNGQVLTTNGSGTLTWETNSTDPGFEIHVGSAQTSNGAVTSATFADFSNNLTLSFTPSTSGTYRVEYQVAVEASGTNTRNQLTLINSVGSATEVYLQEASWDNGDELGSPAPMYVYAFFELTASTSYTFKAQGKASSGTITARWDLNDGGAGAKMVAYRIK